MDTNQAIEILSNESLNLNVEIGTKSNLKAALDIAVGILQGTLQTQLAELEQLKIDKGIVAAEQITP